MEQRIAITIRFPKDLVDRIKRTRIAGESINSLVLAAVEREVRLRQGLQAHERIVAINQRLKGSTDFQPSAAELVRELRDGPDQHA